MHSAIITVWHEIRIHVEGLTWFARHAALGEVLSYIEWFAEKHNKEFHKAKPHYTSTTCGSCWHSDRNSRRPQSEFVCVRCGHGDHADSNAGVNIAQRCAGAAGHVVIRRKEHVAPSTAHLSGEAPCKREPIKCFTAFRKRQEWV